MISKNNNASWEKLTEESFSNHFTESAINRVKYNGLKRNIEMVKKNRERNN
jgi:hypothetical protein